MFHDSTDPNAPSPSDPPEPPSFRPSLALTYGEYGLDILKNTASPLACNPDGAYEMLWCGEYDAVDKLVADGLVTRSGDHVTIADQGRALAWTAPLGAE